MNFIEYAKDKGKYIVALLLSDLTAGVFLCLIDVRKIFILFGMILWLVPFLIVFAVEFLQKRKYYNYVEDRVNALNEKSLLSELIEKPDFLEGKIMYSILKETNKYMNDKLSKYEQSEKEYKEYVEMWVHEIKTPLTLMGLLIENNRTEEMRRIEKEVKQVDHLVEQALFYARSNSLDRDFQIKQITLEEIVTKTLKKNAKVMISTKTTVQMEGLSVPVYADSKWMEFILGQIISNSIKYKKAEEVLKLQFRGTKLPDGVRLEIEDNGIGICENDLERIFDKGFTGVNGRNYARTTGIGLYLCKKMCRKMNLGIEAFSKEGEGTKMVFIFPKNSMIENV